MKYKKKDKIEKNDFIYLKNKKATIVGRVIALPYIIIGVSLIMILFLTISFIVANLKKPSEFQAAAQYNTKRILISPVEVIYEGSTKKIILYDLYFEMRTSPSNEQRRVEEQFVNGLKSLLNEKQNCLFFKEKNSAGWHKSYAFIYEKEKIIPIHSESDYQFYFKDKTVKSKINIPGNTQNPWEIETYLGICENVKK